MVHGLVSHAACNCAIANDLQGGVAWNVSLQLLAAGKFRGKNPRAQH